MAVFIREIGNYYRWIIDDMSDRRSQHFFLIDSFPAIVAIATFYVYFSLKLGPELMKNRRPFNMKPLMRLYNFIQIFANAYIIYKGYPLFWRYKLVCAEVPGFDEDISIELELGFLYYILKYVDLLDTVFFVMRKKNKQISFLHLIHHTGMIVSGWGGLKFVPGGQVFYIVFINSLVHMLMYLYYLISTWDENSNKYLWWKRQLTHLQLLQFGICGTLFFLTAIAKDCNFLLPISLFVAINNGSFIILFSHYYYITYIKKKDN